MSREWSVAHRLQTYAMCMWAVCMGYMSCGMWHVACGMWHVACGMWHVACGVWHVHVNRLQTCAMCRGSTCRYHEVAGRGPPWKPYAHDIAVPAMSGDTMRGTRAH